MADQTVNKFFNHLESKIKQQNELRELLQELRDYMFSISDADHDGDKFVPNEEMKFLNRIDEVLKNVK